MMRGAAASLAPCERGEGSEGEGRCKPWELTVPDKELGTTVRRSHARLLRAKAVVWDRRSYH